MMTVGNSWMSLVPWQKWTRRKVCSPFYVREQRSTIPCEPESRSSLDIKSTHALILDFSAHRPVKNKCPLLKSTQLSLLNFLVAEIKCAITKVKGKRFIWLTVYRGFSLYSQLNAKPASMAQGYHKGETVLSMAGRGRSQGLACSSLFLSFYHFFCLMHPRQDRPSHNLSTDLCQTDHWASLVILHPSSQHYTLTPKVTQLTSSPV